MDHARDDSHPRFPPVPGIELQPVRTENLVVGGVYLLVRSPGSQHDDGNEERRVEVYVLITPVMRDNDGWCKLTLLYPNGKPEVGWLFSDYVFWEVRQTVP